MADKKTPDTKAIALKYDREGDPAPRLTAKGGGYMAEQILELARKHDIPIREDATLVEILSELDLDNFIPLESYTAVAEILSYIYKQNANARK